MDDYTVIQGENPYMPTPVTDAVRHELSTMVVTDQVLACVVIELANVIDCGRQVSSASRELRICMAQLRAANGETATGDGLDELQARRASRRAGA